MRQLSRQWLRGRRAALVAALIAAALTPAAPAAAADPCGAGSNPVQCENSKPGAPRDEWFSPNAWGDIAGFTTEMSVEAGDTVRFKVQSPSQYRIRVYRLGWYDADGARRMSTDAQYNQLYPANNTGTPASCTHDASVGLMDCGNWPVTGTWAVPSTALSGLYIANFEQADGNGVMTYPFVVKDESSHSDIVVQTSDETWQAYNNWGSPNLYDGDGPAPDGRAYKVSYNRPLDVGGDNGIYGSEWEMLAWLERNGYDVSYLSGLDTATRPGLLTNHKIYMSSGHDEYWTQEQFTNVLNARKAGVNQIFASGNEVFWKTRLEPSIDGTNTANRTLVCYKETKLSLPTPNGIPDPSSEWTGTWMDPASTAQGAPYQPENILTGSMFKVNGPEYQAIKVPAAYKDMRIWRNTTVRNLAPGGTSVFPLGTLGYEWDSDIENASRPEGQIRLSEATESITDNVLKDWGNSYGDGEATHHLVAFRDRTSNALVFGTGTVQWSWGLTDRPYYPADDPYQSTVDTQNRMQQATVNVLADMGVQPTTLQSGLVTATKSTDTTGPTVAVTSPAAGSSTPALKELTVTGTATDTGGGVVARTEVSTDGGATWHAATGRTSWTYKWTPVTTGTVQLKVRSVDDSVNIGAATTVPLTVTEQQCPCTVWPASAEPVKANGGDGGSVELGVKIRTSTPGSIAGVKFYKSQYNTGTHTGSIWDATTQQRLATGTFTGETTGGWQTLMFDNPVPVKPGKTYIASYHAPNGGYAFDDGYFDGKSAGLAPITALQSGTDGANGVYRYSATSAFPTNGSTGGANYWVDAILETGTASTTPPTVTARTPSSGATGVAITAPVSATFSQGMDAASLDFTVTGPGGATVPGTVALDGDSRTAAFALAGQLALNTTYTVSVQGADLWGNAMPSPVTWTFTTSATPPPLNCPCRLWPAQATPTTAEATGDPNSLELGTRFSSAVDGQVTGVTFYKGAGNTGTHTGTLWAVDGQQQLATGTFTDETESGWQTLTFDDPVAVTAGTEYVVSYHAPNGHYSVDPGYFSAPHLAYPLSASDGLYRYGADIGYPTGTYNATNYWVGPVFTSAGG
ncbi:hypothetical protein SRB5_45180 [Streptomyces sp. RB5]|uniref:Ig-like domain-containing protein n=1 Tax=Streptomyces smaragdinus TaxID=2585196 RepID=A0A7K0CM61_9ACTN|nr:N,N-dimethylformamidase beta subunit family domain-containing protein [Streptomyces smaragdinus]MQY14353.1 hypothetical protein [Streptomyces smaragdinus]